MSNVTDRRSAQQRNLARFMAYRAAAWVQSNGANWKLLSERTGIHKSDISHIRYGESSSQKLAMKLSKALGPAPLEAFLVLSEMWAQDYPAWKPEDLLPEPITHISLSTEDRWAEMTQYLPQRLVRAGRAVQLLEEGASESMIQDAMDLSWSANKEDPGCAAFTPREWQVEVERQLKRIIRGSGPRESASKIKAADKA